MVYQLVTSEIIAYEETLEDLKKEYLVKPRKKLLSEIENIKNILSYKKRDLERMSWD